MNSSNPRNFISTRASAGASTDMQAPHFAQTRQQRFEIISSFAFLCIFLRFSLCCVMQLLLPAILAILQAFGRFMKANLFTAQCSFSCFWTATFAFAFQQPPSVHVQVSVNENKAKKVLKKLRKSFKLSRPVVNKNDDEISPILLHFEQKQKAVIHFKKNKRK